MDLKEFSLLLRWTYLGSNIKIKGNLPIMNVKYLPTFKLRSPFLKDPLKSIFKVCFPVHVAPSSIDLVKKKICSLPGQINIRMFTPVKLDLL